MKTYCVYSGELKPNESDHGKCNVISSEEWTGRNPKVCSCECAACVRDRAACGNPVVVNGQVITENE